MMQSGTLGSIFKGRWTRGNWAWVNAAKSALFRPMASDVNGSCPQEIPPYSQPAH
jgi:hypothetical protein